MSALSKCNAYENADDLPLLSNLNFLYLGIEHMRMLMLGMQLPVMHVYNVSHDVLFEIFWAI